jgi:hypothetical protein
MRDLASVLTDPVVKDILDLSQPTGLMLSAVLHFLVDDDAPRAIIETLLEALPSGSYLVASHATAEHDPETVASGTRVYNQGGIPLQMRDSDVFARLAFDGLDLIPPFSRGPFLVAWCCASNSFSGVSRRVFRGVVYVTDSSYCCSGR